MSLTPEEAHFQLGKLVVELPDLEGANTSETDAWLHSAVGLVHQTAGLADVIQFRIATDNLSGPFRRRHAQMITDILKRLFAKSELAVPAELRGAVVTAKNAFDIFTAVRRVLGMAQTDVLLVDTKADATVLTDYAVLAPDAVPVRLLTGQSQHQTLSSAVSHWSQRFGEARRLEVAMTTAPLTETLILVDDVTVWKLPDSFSNLAKRKNSNLVRMLPATVAAKIDFYDEIWNQSEPLSKKEEVGSQRQPADPSRGALGDFASFFADS
jgi:hypothetical protein